MYKTHLWIFLGLIGWAALAGAMPATDDATNAMSQNGTEQASEVQTGNIESGIHLDEQDDDAEAKLEAENVRLLAIKEQTLGTEHPDTFVTRNDLARVRKDQGQYAEAEVDFEAIMAIRTRVLGEEHPDTLNTRGNLALARDYQGRYSEAEYDYAAILAIQTRILGAEHPETLVTRHNLSLVWKNQERYPETEINLGAILAIQSRVLGSEHPHTLVTRHNLSRMWQDQGRYTEAEADYAEILEIRMRALGANHPHTLATRNDLARVREDQGRYADAEADYAAVLAIRTRVLGEEHPDTLVTRNDLAHVRRDQGRYAEAEVDFEAILAIRTRTLGEEHPDTLNARGNLALVRGYQGRYAEAESDYAEILAIQTRALGEEHLDTLVTRYNLAGVRHDQGRYAEAESDYAAMLAIRTRVQGVEHPHTLVTHSGLAHMRMHLGRYAEAEADYVAVLAVQTQVLGAEHPDTLDSRQNLARVRYNQGRYAEVESEYVDILAIRTRAQGAEHPNTLTTRNDLAHVRKDQGQYAEAEADYAEILAIQTRVLGAEHPNTLVTWHDIALLRQDQGRYAEAEADYAAALAIETQVLGAERPGTLVTRFHLARVRLHQGRHAEAKADYDAVLAIEVQARGAGHPWVHITRRDLIFLHLQRADLLDPDDMGTTEEIAQHLKGVSQWTQDQGWLASDTSRLAMFQSVGEDRNLAWTHAAHNADLAVASLALYESLLLKDVAGDIASDIRRLSSASTDPTIRDLRDRYRANAAETANLSRLHGEYVVERLRELRSERDELERRLGRALAAQGRARQPATVEALQVALGDQVLIDYRVYWDVVDEAWRLAAVVVDRDHVSHHQLGDWAPVADQVRAYRSAIGQRDETRLHTAASALHALLWASLPERLPARATLHISPDDSLHLLPFSALRNPETGRYLLQDHTIQMLGASRDLLRQPLGNAPKQPVVAYAPHYSLGGAGASDQASSSGSRTYDLTRSGLHFDHLPGALTEGQAISALLADLEPQALSGAAATEVAIRSVSGPRFLHIATHGFYLGEDAPPVEQGSRFGQVEQVLFETDTRLGLHMTQAQVENPLLRSGLALAGANDGARGESDADDGVLTALEAQGLNLAGTELVVLSACDTGVGEVRTGQGVASLQRAFLEAGASSVVYSLWKVDDDATQRLMTSLYEGMLTESTLPLDRLRQVQLEMLASEMHAAPWYWAAFTGASVARQVAR